MTRMRGCVWLAAGLIVALLAGFAAYVTLNRAATVRGGGAAAGPQVSVVVAARAVAVRTQLSAQDVQLKQLPVELVPQGALREVGQAEGRITLVDLYPGEILLEQRLVNPNTITANGRYALVMAADQVLMAFPAEDLMSRVGVLKPGDHVDLLFSLNFPVNRSVAALGAEGGGGGAGEEEQATFNLLQNVTIAAIVAQRPAATTRTVGLGTAATPTPQPGATAQPVAPQTPPEALLLTVSPQDALLLKYALDAGGKVDIVLRAPGAEQPFTVEPVDVDYLINKYRIPTQIGR